MYVEVESYAVIVNSAFNVHMEMTIFLVYILCVHAVYFSALMTLVFRAAVILLNTVKPLYIVRVNESSHLSITATYSSHFGDIMTQVVSELLDWLVHLQGWHNDDSESE